jgi:SHS2 domain-containing protein
MAFRPLEHTADLGIEVRAAELDELFVDAAAGLCDAVTELERVEPRRERTFTLRAEALDLLLVAWLEDLLYHLDVGGELYAAGEAAVEGHGSCWSLQARMRGETFDPERHHLKVQVKAITYHGLEVERDGEGWRARVIFDI